MKMKNVLDQLKNIAENNDSEDVARAIETAGAYSFKDRLKEAEDQGVYGQANESEDDDEAYDDESEDMGFDADTDDESEDMGFDAATTESEDDTGAEDAFDRIHDRVEDRGGVHSTDPWGIGDEDADLEETPGDDDQYCAKCANTGNDLSTGEACSTCAADGSALERVQDRSHRQGDGGPIDRVRGRHNERFAMIDEEIGQIFQTPLERHSWMMNELNKMAANMDPEEAAMVKRLMKKAGEAEVKGGNC